MIRRRYTAALWIGGNLVLALVTWACFHLGLNVGTTGFGFLIAIVLLSQSASRSLPSVALTTFSWRSPASRTLQSWRPPRQSLVITGLMRRPRRLGGALVDVTAA
jgi:hypothetical protein